jgi:putative membrane protein
VTGQPADITGFVYREPSFDENQFMVARFTVSCCVADASAIGIVVVDDAAADLRTDAWVRVQGTMQVGDVRGERAPVLHASAIEQIEQPAHPYLYP